MSRRPEAVVNEARCAIAMSIHTDWAPSRRCPRQNTAPGDRYPLEDLAGLRLNGHQGRVSVEASAFVKQAVEVEEAFGVVICRVWKPGDDLIAGDRAVAAQPIDRKAGGERQTAGEAPKTDCEGSHRLLRYQRPLSGDPNDNFAGSARRIPFVERRREIRRRGRRSR